MPTIFLYIIGIAVAYTFILNMVTTIRVYYEDYYQGWQSVLIIMIIWLIPLLGAMSVAFFLNATPLFLSGVWAKNPRFSHFFGWLFLINIPHKRYEGYPDSSNDYFYDAGSEWQEIGYGHFGEGGGDGGGD